VPNVSTVAALPRRDRLLISVALVLVTALAWAYLVRLDRQMSASMEHDTMMAEMGMSMDMTWTAADVVFTFAMWVVMMVGMMASSAAPVLLLYGAARRARGEQGVALAVLAFGVGYILVWVGFSACAALAQWALHQAALLSPAMAASSPQLGGAILIAAGAYQMTPVKGACLTQCRSPLGFLMAHWRDGTMGALGMGSRHGVFCLGCCWALMCVLFVVGVMNLVWVAALAVFVLVEKTGPLGTVLAQVAGAAMVSIGMVLASGLL
jgi:predicted metal-binding membrane protein